MGQAVFGLTPYQASRRIGLGSHAFELSVGTQVSRIESESEWCVRGLSFGPRCGQPPKFTGTAAKFRHASLWLYQNRGWYAALLVARLVP